MNLFALLPDHAVIAALIHVEAEARKATWDYWIVICPVCQRHVKLEHMAFHGVDGWQCKRCGESGKFNFAEVVKRWQGTPPRVTDELL